MIANWPALIAGVMIGAYWARVVKLVRKTRRTSGASANFVPPEPLGRVLRIIWYPAVGLWIALPLLVAFWPEPPALLRPMDFPAPVAWIALLIAAAAFGATLVCWKKMGRSWRMGINPSEKTELIFTGPYRYVRHPIYALSSVLMLATLAIVPCALMLVVALAHLVLLQWEAHREERHLLDVHGQAYEDYAKHVGRFVPKFNRRYNAAVGP